ncbi:voltage-gated chloride channel family protein [uncultured Flavobacterium sp.]|uniref:voltage-gated chloride channel family protein n=1 Tax=uncultured Flavobacterium sp. TaxID=165435 RepID=UPI0025F7A8CD|nr:voltage-gated chloride channel family protein [uncultured Flavobacterium sp.]
MKYKDILRNKRYFPHAAYLRYAIIWLLLAILIGAVVGSASAFFLISLKFVTQWRESHLWIIAFLPAGGLSVGLLYHYLGSSVVKGNNQLLEEFQSPEKVIPLRMAPLVLTGTLITHLFGGSAGREGTAVQIGGALADRFTMLLGLKKRDRKIILVMGISAGFASVFGTPLAGAVFALEIMVLGRIRYEAVYPSLLVAIIADYTCAAWHVGHTHYSLGNVPAVTAAGLFSSLLAGIAFGIVALLFSRIMHFISHQFRQYISYPPFRPLIGGIFVALAVWLSGTPDYIGLGIPVISEAFGQSLPAYAFAIKLLLTALTLGSGFKGGEVTPLFFIGATLGNTLSSVLPLPMALLAGMGFVAVFAGAANTPMACMLMGMELFGAECGVYIALACFTAYLFSGHTGIYGSQIIGSPKHLLFGRAKGKRLTDIDQ